MFNTMIDDANKVVGFYPTTHKLVEVDMDTLPEADQKPGVDHVMYYDKKSKKIILKEEPRELTDQEKLAKAMEDQQAEMLNLMEALAEIREGGGA